MQIGFLVNHLSFSVEVGTDIHKVFDKNINRLFIPYLYIPLGELSLNDWPNAIIDCLIEGRVGYVGFINKMLESRTINKQEDKTYFVIVEEHIYDRVPDVTDYLLKKYKMWQLQ